MDDEPLLWRLGQRPETSGVIKTLREMAFAEGRAITSSPWEVSTQTTSASISPIPSAFAALQTSIESTQWTRPVIPASPARSFLDAVRASKRKAESEATVLTEIGKTAKLWVEALPSTETLVDKVVTLGPLMAVAGAGSWGIPTILLGYGVKRAVQFAIAGAITASSSMITISVLDETCLKAQALKSTGEETVIYLLPQRDDNPVSHCLFAHKGARQLAEGKKLVVERVSDPKEIKETIENQGNISDVLLSFHGDRRAVSLDRESGEQLRPLDASSWPKKHFADKARVIVHACQVAEGSYSFAELLQNVLGGQFTVVAPTTNVCAGDMHVQDGEVSFTHSGEDVTAKFPRDQTVAPKYDLRILRIK